MITFIIALSDIAGILSFIILLYLIKFFREYKKESNKWKTYHGESLAELKGKIESIEKNNEKDTKK